MWTSRWRIQYTVSVYSIRYTVYGIHMHKQTKTQGLSENLRLIEYKRDAFLKFDYICVCLAIVRPFPWFLIWVKFGCNARWAIWDVVAVDLRDPFEARQTVSSSRRSTLKVWSTLIKKIHNLPHHKHRHIILGKQFRIISKGVLFHQRYSFQG